MKRLFLEQFLAIIQILLIPVLTTKPIQFLSGGYRGLVIGIHSDVPESEQLIKNLETLLKKSSKFLYKATEGRARFVEIDVIIPKTWSKKDEYQSIAGSHYDRSHIRIAPTNNITGDEPYTYQPRGCGEPGEYIRLTDAFIEELNGRTQDNFGYPEKHLVHEWAHYRYGVFDEYGIPGDSKYPTFYMENGKIYPTSCVKGIKGKKEDNEGKPCKIYLGGIVDPKCQFIPDKSDNDALASIMFRPHINSIEKFCQKDGTNDRRLIHNKYAPNKQNILCNYKSTSEVIEEHPDFKYLNKSALSDRYYEPVIRLFRIDEQQSSRFVLVLDVSGSMRDNGRIQLLNRAATRFVNDLIPNGIELGIIVFETDASIAHRMVRINETTRQSLAQTIPDSADGWTAIGKGFKLALEMLKENGGQTRGATFILVSDGEENQKEPTIEEIMPEVLKAGIRVDSIGVGIEADTRLENISSLSGGRCFYMKDNDNAINTVMETAFIGSVSQQSDIEIQSVTILSRDLTIIGDRSVRKKVIIDSELGKNTKFSVSTNDIDVVILTIKSPEGQIFTDSHPYFKKESHLKHIELWIPDSHVGHWEVVFDKHVNHRKDIIVALTVTSEPKNPRHQPIRVNAYFGKLEVRYPATALIYADVKKGQNAIIGARVMATVDRPQNGKIDVLLYDDGSGVDVSANDGVYTTAFTQFTENGRYSVSAKITSDPMQTRVRTTRSHYAYSRSSRTVKSLRKNSNDLKSQFDISDFIPASGKPTDFIESEPIPEFTRVGEAGAFKLEGYRSDIDLIPPGRVTNLQVLTIDEEDQIVELQWTAPGDDAFTGNTTEIDLRVSLSAETLHIPELFSTAVPIVEDLLVAGSLEPEEGGAIMRAKFQIPRILLKFGRMSLSPNDVPKMSFYFAVRGTDESNNTGEISNIAVVHFGYVKPVFDEIIIGTNSRPFETIVLQNHVVLKHPVLFYHNRILLQKLQNHISIRIPKELGRNTKFIITSDDIELLYLRLVSPNGTVFGVKSHNYLFNSSEMVAEFQIPLAAPGKWKVRLEKRRKETVIAYLSVTSESRVDEPIKVRAWMDTPFMAEDKPPNAVINAEVTKRYNYIICADVIAVVDRPKGEPIFIHLHDNGLGADKVPNDGLYSGIFAKFNKNGRYGVNARVINNNKALLKLGVEDEKLKCS